MTTETMNCDAELLATMQAMAAVMKDMNEKMEGMQTKINRIEKVSEKSGKVAAAFDRFTPAVAWSVDKIEQLSKMKHPLLGWSPFGKFQMNAIEDHKTKEGDPGKNKNDITEITEEQDTDNEESEDDTLEDPKEIIQEEIRDLFAELPHN